MSELDRSVYDEEKRQRGAATRRTVLPFQPGPRREDHEAAGRKGGIPSQTNGDAVKGFKISLRAIRR